MPVYAGDVPFYPTSTLYPGGSTPYTGQPVYSVKIGWNSAQSGLIVFGRTAFQTVNTISVTNKALTSNVATLTVPGHSFTTSSTIGVAGVDATFNGTYRVTATTSTTVSYAKTAADVTSVASTGTVGSVQTVDVLGNSFASFFNGAYDDVTTDVQSIRIKRGRDDILSQINAGTAEVELMRPSDRAYWNPANKSSLLNSANAPGFVPMRPIKITATWAGAEVGLFWGYLRSARYDYASGVVRLSCVDLFLFLSRTNPVDPALSVGVGGTGTNADSFATDAAVATDVSSATASSSSRTGLVRTAAA